MIEEFKIRWRSRGCHVTADPKDNSITLSKRLFKHIQKHSKDDDASKVFVFYIPQNDCYGFMLNPALDKETVLCQIQYNSKYKCIGFETLCPSVGYMFYRYGLPSDKTVKLSVSVCSTVEGKTYYKIEKPDEKLTRQLKEA